MLELCRICLSKDVKMFRYDRYQLKSYYEQIMTIKVSDEDGMPQWFCYECSTMLHKFHKFKEKCYSGQKALKEILWKGPAGRTEYCFFAKKIKVSENMKKDFVIITYESVKKIDRCSINLHSTLDIINVNNRVKTTFVRHKTPSNKSSKQIIQAAEPIIESHVNKVSDEENNETVDGINIETNDISVDDVKIEMPIEVKDVIEVPEIVFPTEHEMVTDNNDIPVNDDRISSDDEEVLFKLIKRNVKKLKGQNIAKRKRNTKIKENVSDGYKNISKLKKFERIKVEKFLDKNNWKKFNLTEEQAIEEFKARANCPTYLKSNYQCNDCIKGFSKKEMLARHMKLKHNESGCPLECRFCHMRFRHNYQLSRHLRQHYIIYKCMRCTMRFNLENSASFHDEYHNGVIKTCQHCGKEFRHSSTYYTHLRTHRSSHVCALCGESFVSETGLLQHRRIKHIIVAEDEPTKHEEGKNTYCERCDIKFVTYQAYKEHLSQSALHAESYNGPVDVVPALPLLKKNKNARTQRRKPTTCQYCGKHFSTQSACMKHHLAEHRGSTFLPGRHICEICGASLAIMSLESHLNTHTREKVYPCATCGMQLYSKSSLNRHQLTHTGEKPYKCIACDKRFTQKNSMMLHYRTFHLKQPYPKRNRRKKTVELPIGEAYQSDDSGEPRLQIVC